MDFYESDLEDIIWDCLKTTEGVSKLTERGLDAERPTKLFRQLKIGNYGVADIVTVEKRIELHKGKFSSKLYITVYELKRNDVNLESLVQIFRYIKGIDKYLEKRGWNYRDYEISGILIGKSVNNDDWVYMLEHIKDIYIYTYRYTVDGIDFSWNEKRYFLIDQGFKI